MNISEEEAEIIYPPDNLNLSRLITVREYGTSVGWSGTFNPFPRVSTVRGRGNILGESPAPSPSSYSVLYRPELIPLVPVFAHAIKAAISGLILKMSRVAPLPHIKIRTPRVVE